MELIFKSTDKLGDIVTQFPKAGEVFKEHKIDFCCGGQRSLEEAAKEKDINEEEVVTKLNQLYEETKNIGLNRDWQNEKYSTIIDYVINTHHAYLQKVLPELSELTTKILRVHGPGHQYLAKVHKLFHTLKMDLEQHLIKEEEILFPLIKEYETNPSAELLNKINNTIEEIESEHTDAGDILKELREITEDYQLPSDACKTFARTYELLEEMESDLFQHIHLENNIMFPRLKQ